MPKKKTLEESLIRLEEIVSIIDENEVGLEDAVKLYKEGVAISIQCGKTLEKIEQEVYLLQENLNSTFKLKPFEVMED